MKLGMLLRQAVHVLLAVFVLTEICEFCILCWNFSVESIVFKVEVSELC